MEKNRYIYRYNTTLLISYTPIQIKKLKKIQIKLKVKKIVISIIYDVNRELPDAQAGFRKGRGTRDQIANIRWIIEKQESSRKTSTSALLTMPKLLTVWITINCGKF